MSFHLSHLEFVVLPRHVCFLFLSKFWKLSTIIYLRFFFSFLSLLFLVLPLSTHGWERSTLPGPHLWEILPPNSDSARASPYFSETVFIFFTLFSLCSSVCIISIYLFKYATPFFCDSNLLLRPYGEFLILVIVLFNSRISKNNCYFQKIIAIYLLIFSICCNMCLKNKFQLSKFEDLFAFIQ